MKQRHVWQGLWIVGVLALTALSSGGVADAASAPTTMASDAEGNVPVVLDAASAPASVTDLTEAEIAGLLLMREEEKLAHDVYLSLYDIWGQRTFQNIAKSEATHTEAVLTLLERYDIADPVGDNAVGVFTDPALQALYDDLVARGSESLSAALRVGAAVEEIDILDLERLVAETSHADIRTVYGNLIKGSRNHLRAFVKTLERHSGETYVPQFMAQDAYDAIIGGDIERGGGNGRGPSGNDCGFGGNGRGLDGNQRGRSNW